MGIFKTYLVLDSSYDTVALAAFRVHDYLEASALQGSSQLQVKAALRFAVVSTSMACMMEFRLLSLSTY